MTWPCFCAVNSGSTAAMPFKTPLMFTSIIAFQLAVSKAANGELGMRPAFRKMASILPKRLLASATSAALSSGFVTSVAR